MIKKCQHGSYVAVLDDIALYCQLCNYAFAIVIIPRRPAEIPEPPTDWNVPFERGNPSPPQLPDQKEWEWVLTKSGQAMQVGEHSHKLSYGWTYAYAEKRPDKPGRYILREPFDYTAPNGQDGTVFKRAACRIASLGNKSATGNKGRTGKRWSEETKEKIRQTLLLRNRTKLARNAKKAREKNDEGKIQISVNGVRIL